jgi:hypothetical protein
MPPLHEGRRIHMTGFEYCKVLDLWSCVKTEYYIRLD